MTGKCNNSSPVIKDIVQGVVRKAGGFSRVTGTYRKQNVLKHILECRTPDSGYVISLCPDCGHHEVSYASCNDSCCPICGEAKRERWIAEQSQYILDVPYYHIVFTVPHELNQLFLLEPKLMYNILFTAGSQALKKIGADQKFLGADQMGFMMMLHSFGSNLSFHPHLHCLVAGCGLDKNKRLVFAKKKKYLFPVKALAKIFKGKFLDMVEQEFPAIMLDSNLAQADSKELTEKQLEEAKEILKGIIKAAAVKNWNVELKDRTANKEAVMEYLGRYINRTAISNSRIHGYNEETGEVTFEWKDYRDRGRKKEMILQDDEFIRRFLMHIPPSGFRKIRFYGFWGNRDRIQRFEEIDQQFNRIALSQGKQVKVIERKKLALKDGLRLLSEKKGNHLKNIHLCPKCGAEFTFKRKPRIKRRRE